MNTNIQARVRQPLGLIEVIDRCPSALEAYPDTRFLCDQHGLFVRASDQGADGEEVIGGGYSLFTRIWLGLAPPTGREPGYCAVVGEVFETGMARDLALQAKLRPVFVLDECHDYLMPRLLKHVADLKDIYCPYVDRYDKATDPRRHDPFYQLLIWPQDELLEDVQRQHYGITCYPYEEDLSDEQAKRRWPGFRSRHHVLPAIFPPYKEDPERLYAVVDALQNEKNEAGVEMFGAHRICAAWHEGHWQTPHMAVAMVCAAFQRWDWTERVNLDAINDGYPIPTEEEDTADYLQMLEQDAEWEAFLWSCSDPQVRTVVEEHGLVGYRRLLGYPDAPVPQEREDREREEREPVGLVVPI